jgi:imidazoleglycerol phosphate synthase cyclase subunit
MVKTRQYADPKYVGDPVNVISLFNDFEVDEIILLDIGAARSREPVDVNFLKRLSTECFVPLAFGGGISDVESARTIIAAGFEKLVFNTALVENPTMVTQVANVIGSQAVVGSLDVRKGDTDYETYSRGGGKRESLSIEEWCALATKVGVGEVIVTNIDREGTRAGIDLDLVERVSALLDVPVIAHAGADKRADLALPIERGAAAVAAGTQFVMQGNRESILINYPTRSEVERLFGHLASRESASEIAEVEPDVIDFDLAGAESAHKICVRCLITEDVPGAAFDANGICFYCHLHDSLDAQFPIGKASLDALRAFAETLKKAGKGKKYDCILGVSGGTDSSFLANVLVGLGVRPLAVHFDNTWNSPIATTNIFAVLDKLGVDLETYVVDNIEYDDIYRSFMLAGVKDIEAPTDIGFMGVLYRAAEKHGIKHIVEGHSFRTEGVSPMGWLYMDGGYIKGVHKRFGTIPMKTFPNLDLFHFIKWSAFSRIQRTRPLYWLDYNKEDAKKFLAKEFGWQWYGGHHLENRFTAFYHTFFLPTRFGINFRQIELSALVRSAQLDRRVAATQLRVPRQGDPELIAMVKKRLGFNDEEFDHVMTMPKKTYRDYPTYKKTFERLRPLFWVLYKLNRVPKSFYVKFCKK